MKQFSKNKHCYYCGAPPPSTREHVPPRFLLEPFECDSITVPSCDQHNSEKSLDDRALVSLFLRGLHYGLKTGTLTKNQLKALKHSHEKLSEAREVDQRPFFANRDDLLGFPLAHLQNTDTILSWMRHLTAALTWSVIGECDPSVDWDSFEVESPQYIQGDQGFSTDGGLRKLQAQKDRFKELDRLAGTWWSGWSSFPRPYPPDIYRFEIGFFPTYEIIDRDPNSSVVYRHWFCSQFAWYVVGDVSEDIKYELQRIAKPL